MYKVIYLLDYSFVQNQIDLIDQYDELSNCVILKSTHESIMAGPNRMAAFNKWNIIQDIIENRDYRHFFYFYDENHERTYFSEKEVEKYLCGKSKDFKNRLKALRALVFYNIHLREVLDEDHKVVLLTDSNLIF